MSEEAVRAYRELAICNGATLFTNRTVKEIITDQNKATVNTAHETITGGKLIFTAGKGTNQVLSLINEELPLTPTRKTFSWFDGGEEIEGAGVKIGRHDGGQPINAEMPLEPFGTYPEDEQDVVQFTKRNFSGKLKHRQGKVCTYTMTPDEDFIIDLLPSHENIIVACGFSGHGFKFSSVVGEILSQLAINGETKWDISNFSIKRFRS
jgi:sarcosine oxidase/N-methyl-L-tryptophan oxidase